MEPAIKTYFCQTCDAPYGTCEHSSDHSTLPKEESGVILSNMEFLVLLEAGDI